jgi:hypothetical protein
MKNELGLCTSLLSLWDLAWDSAEGLRRSTARVYTHSNDRGRGKVSM